MQQSYLFWGTPYICKKGKCELFLIYILWQPTLKDNVRNKTSKFISCGIYFPKKRRKDKSMYPCKPVSTFLVFYFISVNQVSSKEGIAGRNSIKGKPHTCTNESSRKIHSVVDEQKYSHFKNEQLHLGGDRWFLFQ